MLGIAAFQGLYFPLNQYQRGGVALLLPLDRLIPLAPVWVLPYMGTWVFWIATAFWFTWNLDDETFRGMAAGLALVVVAGMTAFAFYPTYVVRPAVSGSSWAETLLCWVYAHDGTYNAFPSGHVYITTLGALFLTRVRPHLNWLWALIVAVVAASTVLTGQHHMLDPLGGLLLGWLGYRFGLWVMDRTPARPPALHELGR